MPDAEPDHDRPLAAGGFAAWLTGMQRALRGEGESDVPCDGCTACCRSSQFVHVEPDEADTLARIPAELLFPAPGLPLGHVVLGYDENGHCPMLVDDRCSIYEDRPRACRTYDCRIFPAAGVEPDSDAQPEIALRVKRWRFSHPTEADQVLHDAVRAAERFVRERADLLPGGVAPTDPAQRAVVAVELHDVFVQHDEETGRSVVADPDPDEFRAALARWRDRR